MNVLEITRLALSHSGIGLLPFSLAGIILAMVLLAVRTRGGSSPATGGALLLFWALLTTFEAVKVNTLVWVQKTNEAHGSKGAAKYLDSDKALDNYVILGLYAIFFLYELVHLVALRSEANLQKADPDMRGDGEVLVGHKM